ncbi:unnamed protein product [Ciceribacter sp. T2.26MG-112.2]|nr:unnamed protein product [Ciceribacter naphthalenivorans]
MCTAHGQHGKQCEKSFHFILPLSDTDQGFHPLRPGKTLRSPPSRHRLRENPPRSRHGFPQRRSHSVTIPFLRSVKCVKTYN